MAPKDNEKESKAKKIAEKIKENFAFNIEVNWGEFRATATLSALLGGSIILTMATFLVEMIVYLVKKLFF